MPVTLTPFEVSSHLSVPPCLVRTTLKKETIDSRSDIIQPMHEGLDGEDVGVPWLRCAVTRTTMQLRR